jgi:flagellar biosynthesis protein FlhF
MATITVTAKDTSSAMEDVFEQLGEDAYIIKTTKKNGNVLMRATNDSSITKEKHRPSVKAFSKIFDSKLIDTNPSPKKAFAEIVSTQDALSSKNILAVSKDDFESLKTEISSLKSMMTGLMLTKRDGLSVELGHSLPVQLMQAGFSPELIDAFSNSFAEQDQERGRFSFLRSLSRKLIAPFAENIYDSRIISLVGSSGSGKTTLAAKIATCCADAANFGKPVLVSVTQTASQPADDLKAFGRLLNMPVKQVGIGSVLSLLKQKDTQFILDISAEATKTVELLRQANEFFVPRELTIIQTLAGNYNSQMITHQSSLYDSLEPVIALTKLDECELSPVELSALISSRAQIALLTGTRSIVGAIAIASEAILSQYLKENC